MIPSLAGITAEQITAASTAVFALTALLAGLVGYRHMRVARFESYTRLVAAQVTEQFQAAAEDIARTWCNGTAPDDTHFRRVFNEWELTGTFCKRRIISWKLVWDDQGDRILMFWEAFHDEIQTLRNQEATWYENLDWLVKKLKKFNKRRHVSWVDGAPPPDQVRDTMERYADMHANGGMAPSPPQ